MPQSAAPSRSRSHTAVVSAALAALTVTCSVIVWRKSKQKQQQQQLQGESQSEADATALVAADQAKKGAKGSDSSSNGWPTTSSNSLASSGSNSSSAAGLPPSKTEEAPEPYQCVYPPTRRDESFREEMWGEQVPDPYRWQEDPDSPETKEWVAKQVVCTEDYFKAQLQPKRDAFKEKMMGMMEYDKLGCPFQIGKWTFQAKKIGLKNQYVLYKKLTSTSTTTATPTEPAEAPSFPSKGPSPASSDGSLSSLPLGVASSSSSSLPPVSSMPSSPMAINPVLLAEGEEEMDVLIDPTTMAEDGTAALMGYYFTKDGSKVAYTVSYSGSDWFTIYVKDVETGEDLPDKVDWCKYSGVAWAKDGLGFFYSRYPPPEDVASGKKSAGTETTRSRGCKAFYHKLGTSVEDDQLVYDTEEHDGWLVSCEVTDDKGTLLIYISESCEPVNRLYYRDLSDFDGADMSRAGPVVKLVDTFVHKYNYITNEGRLFYFVTNMDAPRCKVISMELPAVGSAAESDAEQLKAIERKEVVPTDPTGVLEGVYAVAGGRMALLYLRDANEQIELCDMQGKHRHTVQLANVGSIEGLSARKESSIIFFKFVSFMDPGTVYKAQVEGPEGGGAGKARVDVRMYQKTNVPGLRTADFEATQVRYKSKDGTTVPMFIVQRKGQRGAAPCLLYGYGGFNISILPTFSLSRLLFIQNFGGRVCIANIRGGGEYGEEWHKAGQLHNKQNTFDDFTSAAEYLHTVHVTTPQQLAIMGGSNGGLTVGACINQRPELFGCAIAQVGVMDMLRFHKFTIGDVWCSDFGNPDASQADFSLLYGYSPVHNVDASAAGKFPALLLTTADHDDRVVPLHSFKYISAVQHLIGSNALQKKPLLIRIDTKGGHGAGKPTDKVIDEASDTYAFIAQHTGANWIDRA